MYHIVILLPWRFHQRMRHVKALVVKRWWDFVFVLRKKKCAKKVVHVFSAYIKSLHPCVLQLQHQAFILTMNRLCLSMPVITSKLLGTSIIALQKQAEKEGGKKRIPWTPVCYVNNKQLQGKCWMYKGCFVNCILIMLEEREEKQGKQEIKGREGMTEKEDI